MALTPKQISDATAAAIAAGIPNPTPADIIGFAQDPIADELVEETKLPAPPIVIDAPTAAADLQALINEAKANSTSEQITDLLTKIENIALPIVSKATGIALLLVFAFFVTSVPATEKSAAVEILFTQDDTSPQARIVEEIARAKKMVTIQEYQLTAPRVVDALIAAKKRGVAVVAVLDHSLGFPLHDGPKALHAAGIEVFFDCQHAIAHNKLAVIDNETALGGSYNWSEGAEHHNAENLDVFHDPILIKRIIGEIEKHRAHSKTYAEMAIYAAEKSAVEKTK